MIIVTAFYILTNLLRFHRQSQQLRQPTALVCFVSSRFLVNYLPTAAAIAAVKKKKRTHAAIECRKSSIESQHKHKQLYYDFDDCDLWSFLCMLTFDLHWHLMKRNALTTTSSSDNHGRTSINILRSQEWTIIIVVGGMIREPNVFRHDLDDCKLGNGCVSLVLTR